MDDALAVLTVSIVESSSVVCLKYFDTAWVFIVFVLVVWVFRNELC